MLNSRFSRELSKWLAKEISHQRHKLARDFESKEPPEFFDVCNVSAVVVAGP